MDYRIGGKKMKPVFENGNVKAFCPDCEARTNFEYQTGGQEFGSIIITKAHYYKKKQYPRMVYKLLRCAGCNRGGIAKVHIINKYIEEYSVLEDFFPFSIEKAPVPKDVPESIKREFREAEVCTSVKALRAASAMLRSTLEKTLKHNGYIEGNLKEKIDSACKEGIITTARKQRAHEDVRVLGNDILHDEWRGVTVMEYDKAHHYVQRILEDFYDDRPSVKKLLKKANRKIKNEKAKN